MKMTSCKCPECGASVQLNEKLEGGTCNFCGAEIINDDIVKVNVSGEILVSNIDLKKEIETAQKLYESNEPFEAIDRLYSILKRDLFNYDAINLYLRYVFSTYSVDKIFFNSDFIKKTINKFETIKKQNDDAIIKKYRLNLADTIKQYKRKERIGYIIIITIVFIIALLIYLRL